MTESLMIEIVKNVQRTIFVLEKTKKPIFKFQPISVQYLGRIDMTSTFWFCLMPWSKGFFLRRVLQIPFIRHFSRFIYDSMNMKALLAISRDLSTDKQNRGHRSLRNSTRSDKSYQKKNLDENCENGQEFANLTLCQFPDLPIGLYENQYHGSPFFCSILP